MKWPAHGQTDGTAPRTPCRKHSKDHVEDKLNSSWSEGVKTQGTQLRGLHVQVLLLPCFRGWCVEAAVRHSSNGPAK